MSRPEKKLNCNRSQKTILALNSTIRTACKMKKKYVGQNQKTDAEKVREYQERERKRKEQNKESARRYVLIIF